MPRRLTLQAGIRAFAIFDAPGRPGPGLADRHLRPVFLKIRRRNRMILRSLIVV